LVFDLGEPEKCCRFSGKLIAAATKKRHPGKYGWMICQQGN